MAELGESRQTTVIVKMLTGSMKTNPTKLAYLLLTILAVGSTLFYAASTAANFDSFLNANRARPPLDYSHTARFLAQPLPESQTPAWYRKTRFFPSTDSRLPAWPG